MGMTKERFLEIEDRVSYLSDTELRDLELKVHAELMSRDSRLDDFLCEAQADEVRVHQPACVTESVPY